MYDELTPVTYTPRENQPSGDPKPGCYTCPRALACPLMAYQQPCNFRAIYIKQLARDVARREARSAG
jgi:hypothetical protein